MFLNDMSVYIVFGLLFAGILKQFIPENFVKKQLGDNSSKSILKSALLGIPLPLCSCSVLPFASALKKDGASKSAIQTFLIATPITGADSILATWGVFGWVFTLYRIVSSFIISLIAGFLTLIFDRDYKAKPMMFSQVKPEGSCKDDSCSCSTQKEDNFFLRVYNYAFKNLLGDIAKPLFIGMLIATFISVFLPDSFPKYVTNSPLLSYLAMLLISLPIYVCATASIPLAVAFLIAGFSPGAVLIFLTAGPASNMATIMLIRKILGLKSLFIYLISIVIGSFLFAYLLDSFFAFSHSFNFLEQNEEISPIRLLSSIALLAFSFDIFRKKYFHSKTASCCDSGGTCSCH